jgi:hypothetical protein
MCLLATIRILLTTLVLASYSPYGFDAGQPGHLAISLFIARRTRVAASQEFQVGSQAVSAFPRSTLVFPRSFGTHRP